MELYNDVSSFIENGVWDDLLSHTPETELPLLSPSPDLTSVPVSLTVENIDTVMAGEQSGLFNSDETTRGTNDTTSSVMNVNCVQPSKRHTISTQTDLHDSSIRTQTDQHQIAAATQTYFDNQCPSSTQTSLEECQNDKSVTSTK